MAQTGFTPIQLYSSSTPTNAPSAGNLTNDTKGSELAINIADKNLFFKDSTNAVNTVPIRQSSTSSDGWLSSTDWNTFNSKQAALVSGTNIKTVNGTTLLGSGDLGTIGVAYGGTGASTASITAFNNITGYTASGATGTTSTNLVFSTNPTLTTPKATTTIGVGNATPAASGAGITFPATASASSDANTLDDYEEGTWTPTFTGGTTNPTVTYGLQRGVYTKVGRLVSVSCYMSWSAISGGSGNIRLSGLPFAVEASTSAQGAGAISTFEGFTLASGRTSVGMIAVSSTTYLNIRCFGSAVTTQTLDVSALAAAGALNFTVTYAT